MFAIPNELRHVTDVKVKKSQATVERTLSSVFQADTQISPVQQPVFMT